jgi:hypothetical protein
MEEDMEVEEVEEEVVVVADDCGRSSGAGHSEVVDEGDTGSAEA